MRSLGGSFVLAIVMLLGSNAFAQFIPPGHEAAISSAVSRAASSVVGVTVDGISIERDVVVVRATGTEGAAAVLTVHEPLFGISPVVTMHGSTDIDPGWAPLASALSRELQPVASTLWVEQDWVLRPWFDRGLLLAAFLWCVARGLGAIGRRWRAPAFRREALLLALLLATFIAVACTVPAWGPLHDHNTFVARNDCAYALTCDQSQAGGWARPVFHLYGPILRMLPSYDERSIEMLGLGLSAVALGLLYAFTRKLLTPHITRERAIRIAALSVVFAGASPLTLRLAVSDTLWPFTMCLVIGAGFVALVARDDRRVDSAVVAAALLGFAALTSHAMLGLLGLVLAPFCWGVRRPRPLLVLAVLVTLALVASEDAVAALRTSIAASVLSGTHDTPQLLAFHPLFASAVAIAAAPFGLWAAVRARAFYLLPVCAGFLITWAPAASLNDWQTVHPSRLMFTFSEVLFSAVWPALGVDFLVEKVARRAGARAARGAIAAILIAFGLATPLASEGWQLLFERDSLARELSEIEAMLPRLPPHDVLVLPDTIQETRRDLSIGSDPVEIAFPVERYRAAMGRLGRPMPRVIYCSELLGRPEAFADDRVLVYSGLSLRTFVLGEIADGLVPLSLAREQLTALRRAGELRPVLVTELALHDHPARSMRVMADRARSVEIGFFVWSP